MQFCNIINLIIKCKQCVNNNINNLHCYIENYTLNKIFDGFKSGQNYKKVLTIIKCIREILRKKSERFRYIYS